MLPTTHRPRRTARALAIAASALLSAALAACGSETNTALPPATTISSIPAAATSTTTIPPATTVLPTTTTPPTTALPTTVLPATTTTLPTPVVTWDPFVAIDAAGDAVLVGSDGATTLLYDGVSIDEPLPEEGPVVFVQGVEVSADASTAYIGLCCEPSPGTFLTTAVPTVATYEASNPRFGHEPILSPDGSRLAAITGSEVTVTGLDGTDLGYATLDGLSGTGAWLRDVAWIDTDSVVALVIVATGVELHAYDLGGGVLTPTQTVSVAFGPSATPLLVTLAGGGEGVVYVFGLDAATVSAFAGDTLAVAPAASVALPGAALSAVVDAGTLRWIDSERHLHIGETVIAGSFVWVG